MRVLVDADALVALNDKNDSGYGWSVETSRGLSERNTELFLSSYSYGEAVTVLSMRVGLEKTVRFAEIIEKSDYVLVEVDKLLRFKGLEWFKKQTSKNARFTDCVNMALMRDLGIEWVFSRDKHYKQNGFKRLGIDRG